MIAKWQLPTSLIGQNRALKVLRREVIENRETGSYILEGANRVGKKTAALLITKELFCRDDQPTTETRLLHGTHPDLLVIQPEKIVIVIEQVREAIAFLRYPPLESSHRILIIDEFDLATRQAANALLKTLEEPPDSALIFLVTAHSGRLLPTILSRCKRIAFAPLTASQRAEVFNLSRAHAAIINFVSSDRDETLKLEEKAASLVAESEAANKILISFFTSNDKVEKVRRLWQLGDFLLDGDGYERKLTGLLVSLRDGMLASIDIDPESLANPACAKQLGSSVQDYDSDVLMRLFHETSKTYRATRWNHANKKISVESLLTTLEKTI